MLKNITENADVMRVTDCMNFRPAEGRSEILKVTGAPRVIAPEGWMPLFADGPRLLVYRPDNLSIGRVTLENDVPEVTPAVTVIATLPARPLCAFAEGADITVMTEKGAWILEWTGDGYDMPGLVPDWPDISLTTAEGTILSTTIPAGTVDGLAVTAVDTYRSLAADLNTLGQFMQPFVARCLLIGEDGRVLHVTPPVCVTPSPGSQLADPLHLTVSEGSHSGCAVSATGFRLLVSLHGDIPQAWRRRVKAIEVLATPQFHCCDMAGKAGVTVTQRSGAAGLQTTANVFLPGRENGVGSAALLNAICRFDSLGERIAVIDNPFGANSPGNWVIGAPQVADVVASAKAFRKALGRLYKRSKHADVMLSLPHSFTAAMTAENGGRRVCSGLSRRMWRGYGAAAFAAQLDGEGSWQGFVRVVMADGTEHVSAVSGKGTPSLVGPVISYPDPSARKLTITAGDIGLTVDLVPDPSGTYAVWTAPKGKPVALTADFERVSAAADTFFSSVGNLLAITVNGEVTNTMMLSQSPVAILPARASGGAWDFGRSRFYLFGADGIRMLAVSATATSLNLLSKAVVADAMQICQAGATVYLLSAGRLLKLENSHLTSLPGEWFHDRLAYCADRDELLLASTEDNEAVSLPVGTASVYTTPLVLRGSGWLQSGPSVFISTTDGLVDFSRRTNAPVPVSWSAILTPKTPRPAERPRPLAVEVPLWTDSADLRVTVSRSYMGRKAPLKTYRVTGALKSPILLRLATRPALSVEVSIEGTARPDTRLAKPTARWTP
ncbi:MAG: hypothetical protein ACI30N_07905 [Muribaculaceae bacterium]